MADVPRRKPWHRWSHRNLAGKRAEITFQQRFRNISLLFGTRGTYEYVSHNYFNGHLKRHRPGKLNIGRRSGIPAFFGPTFAIVVSRTLRHAWAKKKKMGIAQSRDLARVGPAALLLQRWSLCARYAFRGISPFQQRNLVRSFKIIFPRCSDSLLAQNGNTNVSRCCGDFYSEKQSGSIF